MRVRPFGVLRLSHFIVGQAVLQRPFSELRQVAQTRQHDIGSDSVELRRATRDAIKFLDGQLERAIILRTAAQQRSESSDLKDRLHRAFPEGVLVADNHRASVILKRRRKNFAGRGALPAGQHHQRSGISDARIGIARN